MSSFNLIPLCQSRMLGAVPSAKRHSLGRVKKNVGVRVLRKFSHNWQNKSLHINKDIATGWAATSCSPPPLAPESQPEVS